jgi:nucleotide-binding universal stress UspA family protein
VGEAVMNYVADSGIDVAVLGSRGMGSVKSTLLGSVGMGSVSDFAVTKLKVPVMVVKEEENASEQRTLVAERQA